MILASNPLEQFKAHKKEIISEIKKTLNSGNYVLGSQVHKFEKSFSKFCDAKYAVGVNSGTDAILLSLKALNIGPGDEVITVSHTALATLSAIISSGAKPVIVDIEDDYYTIDPKEFGYSLCSAHELKGGSPEENAETIRGILQGASGPKTDIVILNAAAAIYVGGKAESIERGILIATNSIGSGAAIKKLEELCRVSNS